MCAMFVSNKDETIPLFKNPILEYFSHIHPITPVVVFVPVIVWMMVLSFGEVALWSTGVFFLAGVLAWTLTEYTIHRFAFHIHPTSNLGKKMHFLVHGIHHDYPRDSTRLVMPLLVSVPLAVVFFWAFKGAFSPHHHALYAGFLFGYVAYDSIHYATHHFPMTNRFGRFLKEYHMKHHYVDEHTAYGVSNPLWDYVFNTVPEWARRRGKAPASTPKS
ncbi:MAG: sterol desaturase family protein [Ignavibacteria bacterium]|nr:sterol desaturase family protein [Ignavibacteria bacterium]MBP6509842.1 sterol desaturase family protein [Candidatus Kapabacteria bacterium]MBK6419147.1 sterol desaturase family protein [Ignavibacteria bacterium]MBK6760163.1 sterol desaturase family protein [Ignavibacteria bacterium]MBK7034094.1 sterol desaturase family protein [Ignavibacteria bacterium]